MILSRSHHGVTSFVSSERPRCFTKMCLIVIISATTTSLRLVASDHAVNDPRDRHRELVLASIRDHLQPDRMTRFCLGIN